MTIVIITRGRVGSQHTYRFLTDRARQDVLFCCPPGEVHGPQPHLYEPYPMNYSQKFQWLLDGADGQLGHKFIIMDDDLRFSGRRDGKLLTATDEEINHGLQFMWDVLDDYPLVGFHPRAMGNNAPYGILKNKRINAVQGINRGLFGKVKVDHWSILADMVLNLSLLTSGYQNALICDLFWDQVGTSNAPGGCSLHRTWEVQRDAVLGLQAMFPEFVRVSQKAPKSGWWGQDKPRYDFTIQWQKAAAWGKANALKSD